MIVIDNFECEDCPSEGYYLSDDGGELEVYCVDCDSYNGQLSDFEYSEVPSTKGLFKTKAPETDITNKTNIQIIMDNNSDPYKKQENIMNMDMGTVQTILNLETYQRRHQTLVLVNVRKNASQGAVERATRFVSSLNTQDTIKADIMSASDGNIYSGLVWTGISPGGVDASEIGEKLGFTQVIELTYTGSGDE